HAAHLADLWQMDDVCEALLDLYGAVEEGSLPANARFFAHARRAHEALLDMLDEVAAGQDIAPRSETLDGLRNLLDQALAQRPLVWWASTRSRRCTRTWTWPI
ncbi:hypothetical protein SB912_25940, partial [Pantoea sp. SIMBA_072]